MTETLALVVAGGALFAGGTMLLLSRPLTRILLGAVLLGNGVNLLLLASSGPAGQAPLLYRGSDPDRMPDPLPQVLVLTAIVITLALTAFLVTMAYRAWQLSGTDDVQDDVEDVRVAQRADYVEERDRLRAKYRERRDAYRALVNAEEEEEARERRAYQQLGRARDQYREMRHRQRADARARRARQARAEETAEETAEEDDLWETILGGDR
ncbi:Na(+)/H(+) antiporter subunit C [Streptomyces sp. AJS327]|uniref:Na(+)/H(+) antiporter subunit C n=1 Tax=Streptomyces sp. AJS327 TaxID=2545265 RepID=UPI0015DFCA7F|nr:Na(+)/H(+) antiporter subunit C [Streptomyces sp. AJS327]MBA0050382.1 Na(+)/H(+) antiporter subunit C [Streptomyces sp. AJS327]